MEKHAYLIIAQNEFSQLKKIVSVIDDTRNDIYIHIDKKVAFSEDTRQSIEKEVTHSNIYWIPRIEVNWAGPSQVQVELNLLDFAIKKDAYSYYHLMSAKDLPLQTQDYIHNYFKENSVECVGFFNKEHFLQEKPWKRVEQYHAFPEKSVRSFKNKFTIFTFRVYRFLEKKIQTLFKVNLWKKYNYKIGYGTNWFSISNNLATKLISHKVEISKAFRHSIFGDELLVQSFVLSYPQKFNLSLKINEKDDGSKRFIDWNRSDNGGPHIWRSNEFDKLVTAQEQGFLFARKFDSRFDNDTINNWVDYLKNSKTSK